MCMVLIVAREGEQFLFRMNELSCQVRNQSLKLIQAGVWSSVLLLVNLCKGTDSYEQACQESSREGKQVKNGQTVEMSPWEAAIKDLNSSLGDWNLGSSRGWGIWGHSALQS